MPIFGNSPEPDPMDSVRYAIPLTERKDPSDLSRGYDVIATGTLLEVEGERFAVTANHVLDCIEPKDVLYPTSREGLTTFGGTALILNPKLSEIDGPARNIDIAALRIGQAVYSEYRCLNLSQIAGPDEIEEGATIVLQGYPLTANRTRPRGRMVGVRKREIEGAAAGPETYSSLCLSPELHVAARIDRTGLPKLQGMSGGPMWLQTSQGLVLAGIITDNPTNAPDIVFGTRIEVIANNLVQLVRARLKSPSA